MAFKGPYPTVFSGHTAAMVISHTTFSGGVTNAGTIGTGGISVISGAFLSGGGILDTGTILGGIKVDSSSKSSPAAPPKPPLRWRIRTRSAAGSAMRARFRRGSLGLSPSGTVRSRAVLPMPG